MKKGTILMMLAVVQVAAVFAGCRYLKPQPLDGPGMEREIQRAGYTFRTEVRTINEDDEVYWDTIVVYLTDAYGQTEQFYSQAQPLDTMNWSRTSIGEITEDDWNFDGFPDLQVCTGPMNTFGNYTYDVWLWDNTLRKFVPMGNDNPIFDPYVDSDKKSIVSTWRLDDEVEIVRYKWQDGKLVEFEREEMSYSDLTDD